MPCTTLALFHSVKFFLFMYIRGENTEVIFNKTAVVRGHLEAIHCVGVFETDTET